MTQGTEDKIERDLSGCQCDSPNCGCGKPYHGQPVPSENQPCPNCGLRLGEEFDGGMPNDCEVCEHARRSGKEEK